MADYKKNNRMSGSHTRGFSKNTFGPKELFDTECNSCHKRCQVPFRPNGKKPVYCADCFKKDEAKTTYTSSFHSNSQARPERTSLRETSDQQLLELKREIQTMNATLKELIVTVDTFNRATALSLEIQKHFQVDAPVAKKAAPKKTAAKSAKAVSKK